MKKNATIEGIGFTWDDSGRRRGVRLRRTESGYAVAAFWRDDENRNAATDEQVEAERKRLFDTSKTCNVVAGGLGGGCGIADIDAPDLTADEEKNFLNYELPRHAPMPIENLFWCHRRLPDADDDTETGGGCLLRMAYMTEKTWSKWLEIAGETSDSGVDALLPPAAALDPVLGKRDFIAGTGEKGRFYRATTDADNHRTIVPATEDETDGFGANSKHPLELERLNLGGLETLPPREQATFAGALVLAMYALDDSFVQDRKNYLPLPKSLRPKHRGRWRRVALALLVYTAVIGVLVLGRYGVRAKSVLDEMGRMQRDVAARIAEIESGRARRDIVNELDDSFDELNLPQPSLPGSLAELTRLLSDEYWVSNFQWDAGRIDAEIRAPVDDLSFIERLEASPKFSDVALTRKVTDADNQVVMNLQIMAVLQDRSKPGRNVDGQVDRQADRGAADEGEDG